MAVVGVQDFLLLVDMECEFFKTANAVVLNRHPVVSIASGHGTLKYRTCRRALGMLVSADNRTSNYIFLTGTGTLTVRNNYSTFLIQDSTNTISAQRRQAGTTSENASLRAFRQGCPFTQYPRLEEYWTSGLDSQRH